MTAQNDSWKDKLKRACGSFGQNDQTGKGKGGQNFFFTTSDYGKKICEDHESRLNMRMPLPVK